MLTVIVGLVGSGKSRTCRPFESRYSVMPSTEVSLTGLPGAAAGGWVAGAVFAAGFEAGFGAVACGAAVRAAAARNARSRLEPLLFTEGMESPPNALRPRSWGRAKEGYEYHREGFPKRRGTGAHPDYRGG